MTTAPGAPLDPRPAAGRPFLRPLLGWAFTVPSLVVACLLGLLVWPVVGGRASFWGIAPWVVRAWAAIFGIRRRMEGWEALPAGIREGRQAAIFVGNHASLFDPPLIISTLPGRPVFLAKRELQRVPFLGWVMGMAGFIFIDREHRGKSRASLREAARRIHDGQSIAAFPEGTRSRDGGLLPFKKGVFTLAAEAQVPLVPFAILGGHAVLPKGTWRVAGVDYLIRLGPVLEVPDGTDPDAVRCLAQEAVAALLAQG